MPTYIIDWINANIAKFILVTLLGQIPRYSRILEQSEFKWAAISTSAVTFVYLKSWVISILDILEALQNAKWQKLIGPKFGFIEIFSISFQPVPPKVR